MQVKTKTRRRFDPNALTARDVLIIVPVVVVVLILGAVFRSFVSHDAYIRWGGLALDTAVVFWFFISYSRQYLREPRFWALATSLLCAHLVAWIVLLMHVDEWKLMWFSVMIFELPLFFHLRDRPGVLTLGAEKVELGEEPHKPTVNKELR